MKTYTEIFQVNIRGAHASIINKYLIILLKKAITSKELIKIIKTLYLQKQAKAIVNKRLTKTDEALMNAAEKQLHEEFAIALNISLDEVVPYIIQYISNLEKQ